MIEMLPRSSQISDVHRPQYHFLPPSNWMNDPNGLIQWKGQYHLFYQHNPFGPLWGNMHWGHTVSEDLIHWRDLPIALAPTAGGPDEAGCYSGCAVNNNGTPTLVYTGTVGAHNEIQTQCIATSDDELLSWKKYSGNPVLSQVPAEAGQTRDFRDPFVWKERDIWFMILGSWIKDAGGAVFLYQSQNLIDWEYLNPLWVGDSTRNGILWECPNFFPLGNQWILIVSADMGAAANTVFYFVGSYANHRFIPAYEGVLDYGCLYAPLSFVDEHERRVLVGWLRETRSETELHRAGWAGVQSIPRVLTLDHQHRLVMTPVPELESIRGQHHHYDACELSTTVPLDVSDLALDIVAEFEVNAGGYCGIRVTCSSDENERTDILFESAAQQLVVSTPLPDGKVQVRKASHQLAKGESLKLRVLLDGSVIEIIANDRTSLTTRIYPVQTEGHCMQLLGKDARLQSMDIWQMTSIWK